MDKKNYCRIVLDSGCDISSKLRELLNVTMVPLTIRLKDKIYRDDDELEVNELLNEMHESDDSPKTACPSPEDFLEAYEGEEENLFVVTLSDKLSGSFNSARIAKDLYSEKNPNKRIQIFNSKTASVGGALIAMKIHELIDLHKEIEDVKNAVESYIESMKTFFVLENLEHLAKAGRLKTTIVKIMDIMNLKLILGSNDEGEIRLVNKVRGSKKAFRRFIDVIGEEGENIEEKVLGIAHCNCIEKAKFLKREIVKRYNFKDIVIVDMNGICTTYADEGGIVVAF